MNNPERTRAVERAMKTATKNSPSYLSKLDVELAVNDAYTSGHIHGSGVKNQTEAEVDLCEGVRQLTSYQILCVAEHISPKLAALMTAIQYQDEKTEVGNG